MFKIMNKIIAIVKFNQGEAYVFENDIKLEYTKHGNSTIIGTDGTFYVGYHKHHDRYAQAFAGRKFELKLTDGTVEKCDGQWWSGFDDKAKEVIGGDPIHVVANCLDSLKRCYVFTGYDASEESLKTLRDDYTGKVYEYYEYDKIIKGLT